MARERVAVFVSNHPVKLQNEINAFLEGLQHELIEIKFSGMHLHISAMVVYRPHEEN